MDYEKITRSAYRSPERAESYKRYHTAQLSWGRISTRLEQWVVKRFLRRARLRESDVVLDIPCGTGILGETLATLPSWVVASDISIEMMNLGSAEYREDRFRGFVQADITATPFPTNTFAMVLVLGLMHRIPEEIRRLALAELHRISRRNVVVSFSVASRAQAVKHRVLQALFSGHIPAVSAIPRRQAEEEIRRAGFRIVECVPILPFFSAEALFLLENGSSS